MNSVVPISTLCVEFDHCGEANTKYGSASFMAEITWKH